MSKHQTPTIENTDHHHMGWWFSGSYPPQWQCRWP